MKSCSNCGKVVANGEISCPNCGSLAFRKEDGSTEGLLFEALRMLLGKSPKVFWVITTIIGIAIVIGAVWYYSQFNV